MPGIAERLLERRGSRTRGGVDFVLRIVSWRVAVVGLQVELCAAGGLESLDDRVCWRENRSYSKYS